MYNFSITLCCILFAISFIVIFGIVLMNQEFPCLFNHAFANPDFLFCEECGSVITFLCPNGHRVDKNFCHVCGEPPVK